MATITALANPVTVTAGDTNENVLVFHTNFNGTLKDVNTATIELLSGSVNFNSEGQAAANGSQLTTANTKIIVSFTNKKGISFKAASAADTFRVTF